VYADYGLNAIANEPKTPLISYLPVDIRAARTGNSILRVNTLVDKTTLLSIGINVRVAFATGFGTESRSLRRTQGHYYKCTCP